MPTKADLLSEIDTNLDVVEREEKRVKSLTSTVSQYSYAVLYKEDSGLLKRQGYHIAVENEGTAEETAYWMDRVPEWNKTSPPKTDITVAEIETLLDSKGMIYLDVDVTNREKFAQVTWYKLDKANDEVVKSVWAVKRDNSGGFIAKPLVEKNAL